MIFLKTKYPVERMKLLEVEYKGTTFLSLNEFMIICYLNQRFAMYLIQSVENQHINTN